MGQDNPTLKGVGVVVPTGHWKGMSRISRDKTYLLFPL